MNVNLSTLPVGALIAVGVLVVLQISLVVIALVDLYRRPAAQVVSGNKWIWVAVVLLVNLLGPILYLAIGRKPVVDLSVSPAPRPVPTESITERLYGPRKDAGQR